MLDWLIPALAILGAIFLLLLIVLMVMVIAGALSRPSPQELNRRRTVARAMAEQNAIKRVTAVSLCDLPESANERAR
jgi:Na+-transporting methylmalonyl-CoA/oxaloacetate decarboxylase gamma subunit